MNFFDEFCPTCNRKLEQQDAEAMNHIVYGALYLQFNLNGHSLAEGQEAMVKKFDMTPGASAYVDGDLVEDKATRRLQPGERVEFLQKGVGTLNEHRWVPIRKHPCGTPHGCCSTTVTTLVNSRGSTRFGSNRFADFRNADGLILSQTNCATTSCVVNC